MMQYCPHCGGSHPRGQRCRCQPRKRRPTAADATRAEREPWRKRYGEAEYQRERQRVMEEQRGLCKRCGRVCARKIGGRWMCADYGGEIHHEDALCDGGGHDRLTLLCKSCHAILDARRRRAN